MRIKLDSHLDEYIRMIYDIMNYTQVRKIPNVILLNDLENVFNIVSWYYYLFRILFLNFWTGHTKIWKDTLKQEAQGP